MLKKIHMSKSLRNVFFYFFADELYQLHMEVGIDIRGHLNQVGVRLVALNLTPSFI